VFYEEYSLIAYIYSLHVIVAGFTFPDDKCPDHFNNLWSDWLGEAEETGDWRNNPFYQHLSAQKGEDCD